MAESGSTPFDDALDLRGLSAPEPLLRALEAVDALLPGQRLDVLTPMLPRPLLAELDARGLRWSASDCVDGGTRIHVERPLRR